MDPAKPVWFTEDSEEHVSQPEETTFSFDDAQAVLRRLSVNLDKRLEDRRSWFLQKPSDPEMNGSTEGEKEEENMQEEAGSSASETVEMSSLSTNNKGKNSHRPEDIPITGRPLIHVSVSESVLPKATSPVSDESALQSIKRKRVKQVTMSKEVLDSNHNIPAYDREGDPFPQETHDKLKILLSNSSQPVPVTHISGKLGSALVLLATLAFGIVLVVVSTYLAKGLHLMLEGDTEAEH